MIEGNWGNLIVLVYASRIDEAIAKLGLLLQENGDLSVELMKKDPFWDPLRELDAIKALIENPQYQVNLEDN